MDKERHQKTLSYVWSLKERAEKLREEADDWEAKPRISKGLKKLKTHSESLRRIIKIASKPKLTEKEKGQLVRLTKRRLTLLKKHFLSVHRVIQKNPSGFWDKKIKSTERELEELLTLYEKIVPLLFRKKSTALPEELQRNSRTEGGD